MNDIKSNKEKIDDILTRGVGEFIDPEGKFRKKLENNPEKVIIKFGIDPTQPDIHLGHAVVLRKLRQFQDLGCKIIFLIGDYTAQIGDPTGKNKERPEINFKEVASNAKTYLQQVGVILNTSDENKYKLLMNSIWYGSVTDVPGSNTVDKAKLWEKGMTPYTSIRPDKKVPTITLFNFMFTLKHITHSKLIERDMFQKRIKDGNHLYMHEMMYPVLQGIDSHCIAGFFNFCDLEVGGTDQTFNMLIGRDVMKFNNQEPQAVLAFKLLEGTDGKEKMSKSLDNYIGITDEPNDMYGKTMSIPDSSIGNYFELCTFTSLNEVEKISKGILDGSIHPKEAKMDLAKQIVSIYHGEKMAHQAQKNWENVFSKKEIPNEMEEIKGSGSLGMVLVLKKVVSSMSEWRRLVDEGAIKKLDEKGEKKIIDFKIDAIPGVYKIGKKRFIRIK